jgi:mono/diheme cytochrome c family protein
VWRRWLALGGVLGAFACTPGPPDVPPPDLPALSAEHLAALRTAALPERVDLERVVEGAAVFLGEGNCFICHGEDGKGARGVGADLTDEEWLHSDGTPEAIARQILTGVAQAESRSVWGAAMPSRGGSSIDEDQVEAVAAYVWSLRLFEAPTG